MGGTSSSATAGRRKTMHTAEPIRTPTSDEILAPLRNQDWESTYFVKSDMQSTFSSASGELLRELGVDVTDNPAGYCAAIVTKMYEKLGRPKDLVPVSVLVGEEEHVVFYNTKRKWVIDPTGSQFSLPIFSNNPEGIYKSRLKLTKKEIDDGIEEFARYKRSR